MEVFAVAKFYILLRAREQFDTTSICKKLTHIQTIFQLYIYEFAKHFCLDSIKNAKTVQNGMIIYCY